MLQANSKKMLHQSRGGGSGKTLILFCLAAAIATNLANNLKIAQASSLEPLEAGLTANQNQLSSQRQVVHAGSEQSLQINNLTDIRHHTKRQTGQDSHELGAHFERLTLADSGEQPEPEGASEPGATAALSSRQPQQNMPQGKRTLYACEEKQLQIECQLGESIQLIRANYGRFSIQICNEHGQLDWKVNCMSPSSFQIIANSCQAKQSCQLLASNSIFGDACPGSQKYLEVHYQCVPSSQLAANRTSSLVSPNPASSATSEQPQGRPGQMLLGQAGRQGSSKQNVILQSQTLDPSLMMMTTATTTTATAASSSASQATLASERQAVTTVQPRWPATVNSALQPVATMPLPPWMLEVPLSSAASGQTPIGRSAPATSAGASQPPPPHCPETVWRQVRWPATEPGLVVQMPCPAHAISSNPQEPFAASFACQTGGIWANRVQAGRCQSIWLRNLTQRLEAGDSPLSALAELVHRTRAPVGSGSLWSLSLGQQLGASNQAAQLAPLAGLFGDDMAQIGRVVRRLVDEMGELLNRIGDDKQRIAFAREMLQSLVELTNNLANEQHSDAWLDLANQSGERQRIAGQLVQSLEGASVLFAGAQSSSSPSQSDHHNQHQQLPEGAFLKVTENAFVAIRPLSLQLASSSSRQLNKSVEVSFPSESSTLGTKWMSSEQRFTLHLQATGGTGEQPQVADQVKYLQSGAGGDSATVAAASDSSSAAMVQLKVVFVMIRGLGAQMEPQQQQQSGSGAKTINVNSNLVSLSIVADSRYKYAPIKVDLSAPIELVFRHLELGSNGGSNGWLAAQPSRQPSAPRCAYWDTSISDWLTDGCKLVATNQTHSVCACNHLTTFALLSELDELSSGSNLDGGQNQQQQQQQQGARNYYEQPKVQLDSVENELILPNNKLFYLAKMLDGHLFVSSGGGEQTNARLFIYLSCLISAGLLGLHLAASAYNRAHSRRLLGAIPASPPPPLLVTNLIASSTTQSRQLSANNRHHLQQHQLSPDSTPTYSSDYSAALAASKAAQLQMGASEASDALQQASLFKSAGKPLARGELVRKLNLPIHLLVQLLSLELILVLLVESQNYHHRQRASQANATLAWQAQYAGNAHASMEQLKPIGTVTWLLVFALYYLVSSFTCWLANQLIELNLSLGGQPSAADAKSSYSMRCSPSTGSSSAASDKSAPYGATSSTALSGRQIYGRQAPLIGSNLYGVGAATGNFQAQPQQQAAPHSSTSPSSSFSSASLVVEQQQAALARLGADSSRLYGAGGHQLPQQATLRNQRSSGAGNPIERLLARPSVRPLKDVIVVHALPPLAAGLICWLSYGQSQTLNSLVYTTTFGAQLASWPLLVCSSTNQLAWLLYYAPTVCLLLASLALFRLRQRFCSHNARSSAGSARKATQSSLVNPYGGSSMAAPMDGSASSQLAGDQQHNSQQMALNKQSAFSSTEGHNKEDEDQNQAVSEAVIAFKQQQQGLCYWQTSDSRRAKFLTATLMALLALHSICWISLFTHLSQTLSRPPGSNSPGGGDLMMYAFAAANLLLVLLLTWSQWRSIRRASQLAGLNRLVACLCAGCSAALGGRRCSSTLDRQARFYRQQQSGLSKQLKVSPSSQSLFVVSQAAQLQQQRNQQTYAAVAAGQQQYYAPTYSSGSQQQQHLYQQIAGQQHIYDSTTAINEQQHRLNIMQLVQQQQRYGAPQSAGLVHQFDSQQQQQQPQFSLNRSLNSLHHLQQRQQFAEQPHRNQPMTLKPSSALPASSGGPNFGQQQQRHSPDLASCQREGQLLVLDANGALKQQYLCQQQQHRLQPAGEADGPLVAFSSSQASSASPPATFGPSTPIPQQQPHQAHTQQQLYQANHTEHQLFRQQPEPLDHRQQPIGSAANCQQQQRARLTSGADANQHQYYSINNQLQQQQRPAASAATATANSNNYTEALRAAMIEHQRQSESACGSHHFRRNSQPLRQHRMAMLERDECLASSNNIYDVANYNQ